MRKIAGYFFTGVLFLGLSISANAAQGGLLRVHLDAGELPVTKGALTIYRAGTPTEEGYRIAEGFGGGMVKQEDALSPHLAQWLAETQGVPGKTINLDVDGNVAFSNLEDGLYLITQTERMDGFYPIRPFLVQIPEQGQREIWAEPKTEPIVMDNPQTGQPIGPLLGAMGLVASGVGLYLCVDNKRRK